MPGSHPLTVASPRAVPGAIATARRQAGRWLAKDRTIQGLAGLILAGTVALTVWIVVTDHRQTRARADTELANLVNALEKDVSRNINLFDLTVQETADAVELPGLAAVTPDLRQAALFSRIATADYMASILVLNADGTIRYDSNTLTPRPGNFADRDYFKVPRDHPTDEPYISAPLLSRLTDEQVIVLSRRLGRPGGAFEGVVGGSVRTDYFRHLFSQLELGEGGAITLLRTDGTIITHYPEISGQTGRNIADNEPLHTMLQTKQGITEGVSAVDGALRIYAYRQVGSYPLLLSASFVYDQVFAAWRARSLLLVCAIAVLGLMAATLLVALRRQVARAAIAERRALASAERARRSERTLALSFGHLEIMFQYSADAQFAASRRSDGRFAFDLVNRRAEELSGLAAQALIGKTPEECLPQQAAAAIQANWDRCIANGEALTYEHTLMLQIGRRSWETLLVPVRDADGTIYRLVGTSREVTERKIAEEALLLVNSDLERRIAAARAAQDDALVRASAAERLQVLGQLASGIAHDFNNVLQSVAGCAEIVQRRADDPHAVRRAVSLIGDAAARGTSITQRLLAFSRPDAKTAATVRFPLAPTLGEVADILRHTLRGTAHIDIRIDIADDSLMVESDRHQLQTVLLNLAINARDAMPGGGTLTLGAAALPPGGYVRLWVQDNGHGMDAATLARVTEPFFTTKPVGQGTGLGLSMASAFATGSGGALSIDSHPGAGTTVSLRLPG